MTVENANTEDATVNHLKDCGTHLCLVSKEAAANLIPITVFHPKKAVLFVTDAMKEAAGQLERSIRIASPSTKTVRVAIDAPYDVNRCQEVFAAVLKDCREERPVFNVTGGLKPMAFGALLAAYMDNVPAFYLNDKDATIQIIGIDAASEINTAPVKVTIPIQTYLLAYGYDTKDVVTESSLTPEEEELCSSLTGKPSMQKAVPMLNWVIESAIQKNREALSMDTSLVKGDREAFMTLCDYFVNAGRMRVNGQTISFPTKEDRFFAAGGWLERYVHHVVRKLGYVAAIGMKVENVVQNEIDVAFMVREKVFLVECKTSDMTEAEKANPVSYKLQALRLGGLKTRHIIVSYHRFHPQARKRAEQQGMVVIDGQERLKQLSGLLKQAIRDE